MAGPFESIPFPNLCVSQLGIAPFVRLIYHLTYQGFNSVNYFYDPDICSVKYSGRDDAVLMI